MAGSADITGRQNYVMGIGHPKSTPTTESPPVTVVTNPLTGGSYLQTPSGPVLLPVVGLVADDVSAAATNTAILQAALNARGLVYVRTPGTVWVSDTLLCYSDTEISISAKTTIKLTDGTARNLLVNNAFRNPVFTPITSITASGNYVTATQAGHPFTVGQWVFVEGVGARGYNGTVRIAAVTSSTYSYYSPIAPTNLAPTVYTGPAMSGLTWAMQACPADTNITITGPGTIDWNGLNQTFPNNIDTYGVILHRIYNPQVRNITGKNALKYMFCIAGSYGLRADNIALDTLSDGFDIEMPCFNASINGVSGISGDDFVSILCGDTQPKTFTVGDGFNIVVRDIEPQGPTSMAAIKLAGCAPFIFDEVHGSNIGGTGRLSAAIAIIDDLNMVGGSIGNVSFENINHNIQGASTNGEILQMRMTGTGGRIKIRNAVYNGTAGMGIRVDSVSSFDELDVELICDKAVTGLPLVNVYGTISKVVQRVSTGAAFAGYVGQCSSSAVIGAWNASGMWKGTSVAKGVYQSGGAISKIAFNDVDIDTVRALYEFETAATLDATVYMNNISAANGLGLALMRRGGDMYFNNVKASYSQQAIIDTNNTITINAYFGANCNFGTNVFTNGAANTINARGLNKTAVIGFGATPTFTFNNGNIINFGTLTANVTGMTFARIPPAGEQVVFNFTQDATAGRTITWPATAIFPTAWVDAVTTTDANKKCTVTFRSNGTQLIAQGANKWA